MGLLTALCRIFEALRMTRRPLVAGNWKMNGLKASAGELQKIIAGVQKLVNVDVMV
jgi:triosephosphate isomerase